MREGDWPVDGSVVMQPWAGGGEDCMNKSEKSRSKKY